MSNLVSVLHQTLTGSHLHAAKQCVAALDQYGRDLGDPRFMQVLDVGSGWGSSLMTLAERYPLTSGIDKEEEWPALGNKILSLSRDGLSRAFMEDDECRYYSDQERGLAVELLNARLAVYRQQSQLSALPVVVADVMQYADCPLAPRHEAIIGNIMLDDLVHGAGGPYGYRQYMPGLWYTAAMDRLANVVKPGGLAVFTLFDNHLFIDDQQKGVERWEAGIFRHPFYHACATDLFGRLDIRFSVDQMTDRTLQQGFCEGFVRDVSRYSPTWECLDIVESYYPLDAPISTVSRLILAYMGQRYWKGPDVTIMENVNESIRATLERGVPQEPSTGMWCHTIVYQRQ